MITEGDKITDEQILKDTAIQIFKESRFVLHKWHWNFPELEENNTEQSSNEQTYVKWQLGVTTGETKMLDKKKTNITLWYHHQFEKSQKPMYYVNLLQFMMS